MATTTKITNNAWGTLASGIIAADTAIALTSGQGARFPALVAGEHFWATLSTSANVLEIVKVTARATDALTVVRAQDNTTAVAFALGDRIELRPCAALFNDMAQLASPTFTGTVVLPSTTSIGSVSAAEIAHVDGVTSPIQTQINSLIAGTQSGTVVARTVPVGGIVMWSGTIAAIPSGWALCDGTAGRPDLRNRFIYGAHGTGAAPGTVGGSTDAIAVAHTHTYTGTSGLASADHTHGVSITSGGQSANHTHSMFGGNVGRILLPGIGGGGTYAGGTASTGDYTDTGSTSADHTHGVVGNTAGRSADHTHTVSGTTASTGAAGTNANMPPYYVLAFIICLAA